MMTSCRSYQSSEGRFGANSIARLERLSSGLSGNVKSPEVPWKDLGSAPATRHDPGSHGLCLRHVLGVPESDRAILLRVCRARLDWLAWELEEAARKQSWLIRYDSRGDEVRAWRRSMGQIDGSVFLGADPVADR